MATDSENDAQPTPYVLRLYSVVLEDPTRITAIAELATALSESGVRRPRDPMAADIASTGAPSSLSTLFCPLNLAASGLVVPKVGVPGRPAGGIDVLANIPGYRTHLSPPEFERAIRRAGYVHVEAGQDWAPADSVLFRYRQTQATQTIPGLAVASLLAKKLAVGVQYAGLDGRVAPHGNFGATLGDARRNADLYCEVAVLLGLSPLVFLTDANVPYQPYVGRGEALVALWEHLFERKEDEWLASHAGMCRDMAKLVVASAKKAQTWNDGGPDAVDEGTVLARHLEAQGTSVDRLRDRVDELRSQPRVVAHAPADGFVSYDLARIRRTLTSRMPVDREQYPDDVGVRLLCDPSRMVRRGEAVLEWRTDKARDLDSEIFSISPYPGQVSGRILEVVSA